MPCSKTLHGGMQAKGQTPVEIVGITLFLAGLLLLVFVTTYARNAETAVVLETGEKNIQCNGMAAAIARLYSNRATTSETLALASEARLRRVEGKPGGINVGEISCSYIGSAERTGGKDSDPDGTGTEGITLSAGQWCLEKRPDTGIVISEGECG